MGWTVIQTTQERGPMVRAAECEVGSLYQLNNGEVAQCYGSYLGGWCRRFRVLVSGEIRLLACGAPAWKLSGPVQLVFDPRK